MKNIQTFKQFLNEGIQFDDIESILRKTANGTKIIIRKHNEDKERVVYYRGFRNGKHWANYSPQFKPYQNDIVIFPSRQVSIDEINKIYVETKGEFKDRIEIMKELDNEKRNKEKEQIYRDAYLHSKKYPNVD